MTDWLIFYYTQIIRILTLVLLCLLLKIYINSYKKINIGYTVGLLLFTLILLTKISTSFIYSFTILFTMNNPIFPAFTNNMAIESTFELIAISILYKITKD